MTVSNEQIMKKLDKIESMISKLSKEEEEELKTIEESNINLAYANIDDWRTAVWEGCKYKEEQVNGDEIDFFCRKNNARCQFEGCPLNVKS